VRAARFAKIVKADLRGGLFSYSIDEAAKAQAELADGKLPLVTNRPGSCPSRWCSAASHWLALSVACGF
jgi:hypothetical protein